MTSVDLPDWVPGPTPGPTLLLASVRIAVANGATSSQVVFSSAGLSQIVVTASSTVAGPATVTVKWYQNQSMVGPVIQQYAVGKNSTGQSVWVFPVLAPWFQVYWTNSSGVGQTVSISIYGYNSPFRLLPLDLVAADLILDITAGTIPSPQSITPSLYLPGPANIVLTADRPVLAQLQQWNSAGGTWDTFWTWRQEDQSTVGLPNANVVPGASTPLCAAPPAGMLLHLTQITTVAGGISSNDIMRIVGTTTGIGYAVFQIGPPSATNPLPTFLPLDIVTWEGLTISLDAGPTGNIFVWPQVAYLARGGMPSGRVILPDSDWRLQLNNNGGGTANYTAAIMPAAA